MSLSSFLFTPCTKANDKGKSIDKGLDDFFRSSTAVASTSVTAHVSSHPEVAGEKEKKKSSKEKKRKQLADDGSTTPKSKKAKAAPVEENTEPHDKKTKKPKSTSPDKSSTSAALKSKSKRAASSGSKGADNEPEPEATTSVSAVSHVEQTEPESDSDGEGDPKKLVHESVANAGKPKHGPKSKYVPEGETAEQRNERTVFVGNVPIELVKNRPLQKQLKHHILSFAPSAKIESVRFRSVAFNKPTAELPANGADPKSKDGRQHDRDRAATWRKFKGEEEDAPNAGKVFLTPAEKKRVAFIKQELHDGVDAANAYIVFAHPPPPPDVEKAKHLPPPKEVMDPYEAVRLVVKEADRSVFMGRTLRVDAVAVGGSKVDADGDLKGDSKMTIFVGSLDFASKDEDLRAFFETLMVTERGKPPAGEEDEDEEEDDDDDDDDDTASKGEAKRTRTAKTWVKHVRIIRDKDTLLGKGFAYVQFADRECVDEILALEPERLKFAKRKLRVQRCKTLPGASKLPKQSKAPKQPDAKSSNAALPRPPRHAPAGPVPKGDPALGEKLAGLSKEERKAAKATDADRVARRAAKKRAKVLAEKGVKSKTDVKTGDLLKIRKRTGQGEKGKKAGEKKKGRVRSGRAIAKLNTKK